MVKAVSQSDSIFSREEVAKITRHFSIEDDTCREKPEDLPRLYQLDGLPYPFINSRPMPRALAWTAMDFIRELTKKYPFNIRYDMGQPMWERFTEAWDLTKDQSQSLKVI